jgi:hypothetical protein
MNPLDVNRSVYLSSNHPLISGASYLYSVVDLPSSFSSALSLNNPTASIDYK